jgi:hypothetical protein
MVKALVAEMRKQGWTQKAFSTHLGFHPVKIDRWVEGSQLPRVSQMEAAWRELGYTLLPVRLPSLSPRLVSGKTKEVNRVILSQAHPIIFSLLSEIEQRKLIHTDVLEAAGLAHDTFRSWAKNPHLGRIADVEACFNVMGLSLLPFPVATLGLLNAA